MECGMERRFHRGFTAAEKTELWDRWKRGESLKLRNGFQKKIKKPRQKVVGSLVTHEMESVVH
jgi:hypothetical protein